MKCMVRYEIVSELDTADDGLLRGVMTEDDDLHAKEVICGKTLCEKRQDKAVVYVIAGLYHFYAIILISG